jgi:hypothetical protein
VGLFKFLFLLLALFLPGFSLIEAGGENEVEIANLALGRHRARLLLVQLSALIFIAVSGKIPDSV